MSRRGFATLIYSLVLVSIPALAQEEGYTQYRSELTAQATGDFVKSTTRNGITEKADHTAGVLAGYRFYFNRHNGVELNYGYTQNCLASITFPSRRQLFLPTDDNYTVYEIALSIYTDPDRSRG